MYCSLKQSLNEVLSLDVEEGERVFVFTLTRGEVRHIAQDWNLSDDELEIVMQRLSTAFEYGAEVKWNVCMPWRKTGAETWGRLSGRNRRPCGRYVPHWTRDV